MSEQGSNYVAIGVTHSRDTRRLLGEILQDPKFGFAAEGTMVSGYELYVTALMAKEAVDLIRSHPKIHIEDHKVRFYGRARYLDEGTRYDRLLDEYCGEDPRRPPVDGISFEL